MCRGRRKDVRTQKFNRGKKLKWQNEEEILYCYLLFDLWICIIPSLNTVSVAIYKTITGCEGGQKFGVGTGSIKVQLFSSAG